MCVVEELLLLEEEKEVTTKSPWVLKYLRAPGDKTSELIYIWALVLDGLACDELDELLLVEELAGLDVCVWLCFLVLTIGTGISLGTGRS